MTPGPRPGAGGQCRKLGLQRGDTGRSQAIWTPPIRGGQRFDQSAFLQARQRAVERARPQAHVGEGRDVLHHGVAMLGAAGQAHQDEERRLGESPPIEERTVHELARTSRAPL
jgi:hypothetical protein